MRNGTEVIAKNPDHQSFDETHKDLGANTVALNIVEIDNWIAPKCPGRLLLTISYLVRLPSRRCTNTTSASIFPTDVSYTASIVWSDSPRRARSHVHFCRVRGGRIQPLCCVTRQTTASLELCAAVRLFEPLCAHDRTVYSSSCRDLVYMGWAVPTAEPPVSSPHKELK